VRIAVSTSLKPVPCTVVFGFKSVYKSNDFDLAFDLAFELTFDLAFEFALLDIVNFILYKKIK
jgi:hypothetical protein